MGIRRISVLASAIVVTAGTLLGMSAAPAGATGSGARPVVWGPCRSYTDDQLREELHGHDLAALEREIARMQCGTMTVPLNYRYPQGRQLRIAVTRLRALEPRKRIGVLTINPGGPGESGVLEPPDVSLSKAGDLAKRFDLVGFDPRGIGDSTPRLACDEDSFSTDMTTDRYEARQISAKLATPGLCQRRSALTASLTTSNIARDLDRIRAGLGERKISYFGFPWGTALGATYQTLFPRAGRPDGARQLGQPRPEAGPLG